MLYKLQVIAGAASLKQIVLRRPRTVVGRKKGCKIRIQSERVSRIHCSLICHDGRLTIKDLSSSNGTFVNGQRISECALNAGDVVEIGPIKFAVVVDRDGTHRPRRTAEPVTVHDSAADPDAVFFETDDDAAGDEVVECQLADESTNEQRRKSDETPPSDPAASELFETESGEVLDAEQFIVPDEVIDEGGYSIKNDSESDRNR